MSIRKNVEGPERQSETRTRRQDVVVFGFAILILVVTTYLDST
ncbi:hypothetical protein ACWEQV_28735 [Rhodococcus aetherivorans]|nr:hypothetical protein [Rhodococcus sp. WB1]